MLAVGRDLEIGDVAVSADADARASGIGSGPEAGPVSALVCKMVRLDGAMRLEPQDDSLQLVVPIAGSINVAGSANPLGDHVLIGGDGEGIVLSGVTGQPALLIRLPRHLVQAAAYAAEGIPRRIGRIRLTLPLHDPANPLVQAIARMIGEGGSATEGLADDLVTALAAELLQHPQAPMIFSVASAVQRALDRVTLVNGDPVVLDDLLRAAGVTQVTLRRTIKETTGLSLSRLVHEARLEWGRLRLESHLESRSLSALADALGYRPSAFTRAYQRFFGETPTQTRTRAFVTAR